MSAPNSFPLAMLQLVADRRQSVAALLLHVFPKNVHGLSLLFAEPGLTEALGTLPCLFLFDDLPRIDAETAAQLPANRITLMLPPSCTDLPQLKELQILGFGTTNEPLATQVDSHERFAACMHAGTRWFTGSWYLEPLERKEAAQVASRALMLRLLQLLAADAETHELESVFKQDPQLSYHLLKLVNSVAMGLTTRIGSFRQAIVILGRRQLQRWLHLAMFAQQQQHGLLDPLQATAVLRARLLEQVAGALGMSREDREQAFMAGMFSLLGVLFCMPLEKIIQPLNLADPIVAALLERKGTLGLMLRMAEAAERADGEALASVLAELGLSNRDFDAAQFAACRWMQDITREAENG